MDLDQARLSCCIAENAKLRVALEAIEALACRALAEPPDGTGALVLIATEAQTALEGSSVA